MVESFARVVLIEFVEKRIWNLFSVYGPNDRWLRDAFWRELEIVTSKWFSPWCVAINMIWFSIEHGGGCRSTPCSAKHFRLDNRNKLMDICDAVSIMFGGQKWAHSPMHGTQHALK